MSIVKPIRWLGIYYFGDNMDSFEYYNSIAKFVEPMLAFRYGKEFSQLELLIGCVSFLNWLEYGRKIDYIDYPEYKLELLSKCPMLLGSSDYYFEYANESARRIAIQFCRRIYNVDEIINTIKETHYYFNPTNELNWADPPISPNHVYWEEWEVSFTRSMILITRGLAYNYINGVPAYTSVYGHGSISQEIVNKLKNQTMNECNRLFNNYTISQLFPYEIFGQ